MSTSKIFVYRIGLRSQLRAMLAVAKKDWMRYWRYPLNAVSSVLQPLIWLAPVFFMGQAFSINGEARGFAGYAGTSDYMSFILVGTALTNFINSVFWGMGYSMKEEMDAGVLESNWLSPISRPLLLVGHTFTSLIITAITSMIMLLLGALIFGFHPTGDLLRAVLSVLPMLIGLYGFGFAFASLVLIMREANTMVDVSSFLLQILSGADFPVNALPRWLLPIALAVPLTYGFDAVRGWLLNTHTLLPLPLEAILMVVFMFVMIILGLRAFHALERRASRSGIIGTH